MKLSLILIFIYCCNFLYLISSVRLSLILIFIQNRYLEEVLGDALRRPLRLDEPVVHGVEYELHLKPVHDINMTRTHNSSFGFTLTEVRALVFFFPLFILLFCSIITVSLSISVDNVDFTGTRMWVCLMVE